jgi:hypothetical protein
LGVIEALVGRGVRSVLLWRSFFERAVRSVDIRELYLNYRKLVNEALLLAKSRQSKHAGDGST